MDTSKIGHQYFMVFILCPVNIAPSLYPKVTFSELDIETVKNWISEKSWQTLCSHWPIHWDFSRKPVLYVFNFLSEYRLCTVLWSNLHTSERGTGSFFPGSLSAQFLPMDRYCSIAHFADFLVRSSLNRSKKDKKTSGSLLEKSAKTLECS